MTNILDLSGEFCWCWNDKFFIQTDDGNFIWSDPQYNGDNTIRRFKGTLTQFCIQQGIPYARGKGKHIIKNYCGKDAKVVES